MGGPIKINVFSNYLVAESQEHARKLVIERETGHCHCTDKPLAQQPENVSSAYMLLGFVQFQEERLLATVYDAVEVGTLWDAPVYAIKQVVLIPCRGRAQATQEMEEFRYELSSFLASGFYFSHYYDLTNKQESSTVRTGHFHNGVNMKFYWNAALQQPLRQPTVDPEWAVPVIHGFVGIRDAVDGKYAMKLTLISRRAVTGAWPPVQGINHEGDTSNFVETEQLLEIDGQHFSYVQCRGSVPLYWDWNSEQAQVLPHLRHEEHVKAFQNHSEELNREYSEVVFVSVVPRQDSDIRNKLKQVAHDAFQSTQLLDYFDFNQPDTSAVVEWLAPRNIDGPHYFNQAHQEVKQPRVLRVCHLQSSQYADTTQECSNWASLQKQLTIALNTPFAYPLEEAASKFSVVKELRNLWKENCSQVARQNTPNSYMAAIYSVIAGQQLQAAHESRSDELIDDMRINLKVLTWNLAGRSLDPETSLQQLLFSTGQPDILVFNIQEVVKLDPWSVLQLTRNREPIRKFDAKLREVLGSEYIKLLEDNLVGCVIFMYVKKGLHRYIKDTATDKVKVGFKGMLGNKGAVLLRFALRGTTVCVYGCHLESGDKNAEKRKAQLKVIVERGFQRSKDESQRYGVLEHDIQILAGDLNFRIDMPKEEVKRTLLNGEISRVYLNDQLRHEMHNNKWMEGYVESPINFVPTYKFDKGTSRYDTSKKQRSPAWCDRILFKGNGIHALRYASIMDYCDSDHKPVYADFHLMIQGSPDSPVQNNPVTTQQDVMEEVEIALPEDGGAEGGEVYKRNIVQITVDDLIPLNDNEEVQAPEPCQKLPQERTQLSREPEFNFSTSSTNLFSPEKVKHLGNAEPQRKVSPYIERDLIGLNGEPEDVEPEVQSSIPHANLIDI